MRQESRLCNDCDLGRQNSPVTSPEIHADRCCSSSENGGRGGQRHSQAWDPGRGSEQKGRMERGPRGTGSFTACRGHSLVRETQLFPEDSRELQLGWTIRIASDESLTSWAWASHVPKITSWLGSSLHGTGMEASPLLLSQQEPFSAPRPPVFPATALLRQCGLLLQSRREKLRVRLVTSCNVLME